MADSDTSRHWLELYREAILEPDRRKTRTLAAQADRCNPEPSQGIVVRRLIGNQRAPTGWTRPLVS